MEVKTKGVVDFLTKSLTLEYTFFSKQILPTNTLHTSTREQGFGSRSNQIRCFCLNPDLDPDPLFFSESESGFSPRIPEKKKRAERALKIFDSRKN